MIDLGWTTYLIGGEAHIIPDNDMRPHVEDRQCECKPTQDDEAPAMWIHHSFDGREAFERGERKLS